jgi:hypothetical protein
VYKKEFDVLFEEEHDVPSSRNLAEKMGVTKGGQMFMNEAEWDAASKSSNQQMTCDSNC